MLHDFPIDYSKQMHVLDRVFAPRGFDVSEDPAVNSNLGSMYSFTGRPYGDPLPFGNYFVDRMVLS